MNSKHLIIIVLLGSLLACTGQPSGSDANSVSAQKYPYRFHCYTSHIYVDAFLNDSLPVKLVYDCAAPFVWLDSSFVDDHYGYESKQTMAFEGIGTEGRQVVKAFQDWNITIAGKREWFPIIPAPNLRSTFNDSIDGVIGLVFIKKHVWAFDFGTHSFDGTCHAFCDGQPENFRKTVIRLRDGHGSLPFRGCGAEIGYWKFGYSQGFKNHPRGFR